MKKNFFASLFCFTALLTLCISCGGGGGGGSTSFSLYDPDAGPHNGGGGGSWNGYGSSNSNTESNGISNRVRITGGTSLQVERYVYKGQSYTTAEKLLEVLAFEKNLPNETLLDVYVPGEASPRKAKYVKTATGSVLRHPYTLTIKDNTGATLFDGASQTPPEYCYANEGFEMSKLNTPADVEQLLDGETINFPYVWKTQDNQSISPTGSLYGFEEGAVVTLTPEIQKYTVTEFGGSQTLFISSTRTSGEEIVIPANTPAFENIASANSIIPFKLNLTNATINDTYGTRITSWTTGIVGNLLAAKITEIKMPGYVTSIGDSAFSGWNGLTTMEIPGTVSSIGQNAFYNCSHLETLVIPPSVTTIGNSAFNGCSTLQEVTIPCKVLTSFRGVDSITKMTITPGTGENYAQIPTGTFNRGFPAADSIHLHELIIADGITSISADAFRNIPQLNRLTIPASVTIINSDAFNSQHAATGSSDNNLYVTFGCTSTFNISYGNCVFQRDWYDNTYGTHAYATFSDTPAGQRYKWSNPNGPWVLE